MNDNEIIADMARELTETKARCALMTKAIEDARMHIICIGGPLNDNKLQFNKEQLKLFFQIDNCLDILA